MSLFFKKSLSLGPLRFNLSKSGIGVSAGIPGFRVGTGPRGNYVQIGMQGLYYRATLKPGTQPTSGHPVAPRNPSNGQAPLTPAIHPGTHAPLMALPTTSVQQLADSSFADTIRQISDSRRRISFFPLAATLFILALFIAVANAAPPWGIASISLTGIVTLVIAYHIDVMRKSVVIFYDPDESSETAYRALCTALSDLCAAQGKWRVDTAGRVYDPKYHAGAGQLVSRTSITASLSAPPGVYTNTSVYELRISDRAFYFLPDVILLTSANGVATANYKDVSFRINTTQFIEDGSPPRDATVVGSTWRYVNKSGGPDRRFNNNRTLPICLYEEIHITTSTGINELIQVSKLGLGDRIETAMTQLASILSTAEAEAVRRRYERNSSEPDVSGDGTPDFAQAASSTYKGNLMRFETLLSVLCCVTAADKKVTRREIDQIKWILAKVHSPWTDAEIDARVSEFIAKVRKEGFENVLATVCSDSLLFKTIGKEELLLHSIDLVASADHVVSVREQNIIDQFRNLMA